VSLSEEYDPKFLLALDLLSFHDLAGLTDKIRRRRALESALAVRAGQADEKGWKKYTEALGEKKVGTADDFAALVKAGRV
jgi:hypothetical protein